MDYGKGLAVAAAPAAAGTLAYTGPGQMLWYTIAAVGLIGAGLAIGRFAPKEEN